jgi:hypothetical protein
LTSALDGSAGLQLNNKSVQRRNRFSILGGGDGLIGRISRYRCYKKERLPKEMMKVCGKDERSANTKILFQI